METHRVEDVVIAAEGAQLSGRFYRPAAPAGPAVRAHLVLHPATGVPQRYYRAFAEWACAQGVGVLTYDYRDSGASARGPLKGSRTSYADWLIRDQGAAQAALAALAPEGPLWVLGHSLGGLGLPFRTPDRRVEKIVTIGTGQAFVLDHPPAYLPRALAFWFGPGPLAALLFGYMPGRRLLLGADLPKAVYWQFRRWCVRRDFWAADIGRSLPPEDYARPGPRIRLFVADDDQVMPPVAVRRYAAKFGEGAAFRALSPAEFGLKTLGHIETMSARSAAIWPVLLDLPAAGAGAAAPAADAA